MPGELYSGWGLAKALLTIPQRQTAGPIKSEMEASPVNTAMVLTPSGKFFALNEGGAPFELELDWDGAIQHLVGFETKTGRLDFPLSAHPKVDRATGEVFFHGYSLLSSKAFLRMGRLGADGKVSPSLFPASTRALTLARRGRAGGRVGESEGEGKAEREGEGEGESEGEVEGEGEGERAELTVMSDTRWRTGQGVVQGGRAGSRLQSRHGTDWQVRRAF